MKKLVYISLLLSCSFLQSAEIESQQIVQQTSKQDVSGGERAIFSKFSQLPDKLQLKIVKQANISPLQQLADQAGLPQNLWKGSYNYDLYKQYGAAVNSVSWSPDGKLRAVGNSNSSIQIIDYEAKKLLNTLGKVHNEDPSQGHIASVDSVSWSPTGTYIASGSDDTTVRIWDAKAGKLLNTLGKVDNKDSSQGHIDIVESVSWSPDSKYVVSGSDDRTVRIWDAETGKLLNTLGQVGNKDTRQGHIGWVTSVSWSPDGKYIASGSYDRTVRIWDAQTGSLIETLETVVNQDSMQEPLDGVELVSWMPDGKLVSIAGTVIVWEQWYKSIESNLSVDQQMLVYQIWKHQMSYQNAVPTIAKEFLESLLARIGKEKYSYALLRKQLQEDATSQIFKLDLNKDQFAVYTTLPVEVKNVLKHFVDEKSIIRDLRIQRLSQPAGTREQKEEKE